MRWLIGITLFVLSFFRLALAQEPSFRAITTEQGLPSNEIYTILEDKKGFIWIGCDAGLFRYNGIQFIPYKCAAQKSKSITGLCQANDGTIYCYNFVGQVFCIKNDEMQAVEILTKSQIVHIATSHDNLLWLTTKNGIYYYNSLTKLSTFYPALDKKKPHFKQAPPTRVLKDNYNNIWFVEKLVGRLEPNKTFSLCEVVEEPTHTQQELLGNSFVFASPKATWLVSMTTNYFYKLKNNTFYYQDLPTLKKSLKGKKITNVFYEKEDRIWILTFTGIFIYDFKTDTIKHILEEYAFSYFLIDKDGAYWLTTLYDGLLYIPNFEFKNWRKEPQKILKMSQDESHIYFGNTKGELHSLDTKTNQIQTYTLPQTADIRSINYDLADKVVYFNVNNILYQLKNNQISIAYENAGSVKSFLHLPQGYIFATSAFTYFLPDFATQERQIISTEWGRAIAYNNISQIVWVATNKGLVKSKKINGKWIIQETFFKDIQIVALAFDEANERLYAVNFEGKLYQIEANMTAQHQIKPFAYLPTEVQAREIILKKDVLLIASNQGVYFLDIEQKTWENIGKLEGLISEDVHNICVLANQIWLGTSKGLQSIPFERKKIESHAYIVLKDILVNQQKIVLPKNLQLSYQDDFKIGVEGICYLSGDKFRYAYRLKTDGDWNYLPANTDFIHFSSLAVGKFKIEIKIFDHQNRSSNNTIWIEGEVLPPFWQNIWFIIAVFVLLVLLVYWRVKQNIYTLKQKQKRILEQVMLENELKLWQQTALQAQMNPHFLFNVLNSIKTYIYENDKPKAILYLNNFANLVRKVLHNSTKTKVSLAEEIATISLYIGLEAMLLEENFEWKIEVDTDLEVEEIYLPTFLLQPFVENAFKHGLRHQKGLKKLYIDLQNQNNQLIITIEDNGIGREKSRIINEKNDQKHTSFATKNIQERLDIINQNQEFYLTFQIIDLQNEIQEAVGTKIILNIQFIQQ
ncbi:MAG: hypothetical protein EAZ06_01985 [Cytophagales bacterium]|nr:MAG: hypothetical protein EAZ06_01985 [Cytophagales bacterium]